MNNIIDNTILKKAVVLAIIAIFIGSIFVPAVTSINYQKNKTEDISDETSFLKNDKNEENIIQNVIDQKVWKKENPFPLESRSSWHSNLVHWQFRKNITINHSKIDDDLTNFPVLINLPSDSDLADDSKCQNDGDDIVFTDKLGNQLNHEIESFDGSTGKLVAWVNVTSLSSTSNTTICMYYGNPMASDQQNPAGVWDSSTKGVWHLHEPCNGDGGIHTDSTMNGNNAIPHGGVTTNYEGIVGGGYDFNGDNDWLEYPRIQALPNPPWTFTLWFNLDVLPSATEDMFLFTYQDGSTSNDLLLYANNDDQISAYLDGHLVQSGIFYTTDTWYQVTAVYESGAYKIYVNGNLQETESVYFPTDDTADSWQTFRNPSTKAWGDGTLDEVRFSSINRTSAWIKASYNTQIDPNSFISIGSESQLSNTAPRVVNPIPEDNSQEVSLSLSQFNITVYDPDGDLMDIYWTTNASGSWKTFNSTDSSVINGTYYAYNTSWINKYGKKYWWGINCKAGSHWSNRTFSFISETLDWYSLDWMYRKKITIDHSYIDETLIDFPILIDISDSDIIGKTQTNGEDILFATTSKLKLDHDIEYFDSSSGKIIAWVKIPNLSSLDDTEIFMYYGNLVCNDQENQVGTWDNNYDAVWHMDDLSGGSIDATGNDYNGTGSGGLTYNVEGKIGRAIDFNGATGTIDSSWYPYSGDKTLEIWINFDEYPIGTSDVTTGCHDTNNHRFYVGYDEGKWFYGYGSEYNSSQDNVDVSEDEWVHLALTGDGSTAKFYVNGEFENSKSYTWAGTSSDAFHIGSRTFGGSPSNHIDGIIDEVRISTTVRNASWIKASYYNQHDISSFLSFGEEALYIHNPWIHEVYPEHWSADIPENPILKVRVDDLQGDNMDIVFSTNASGTWTNVQTYSDVTDGFYSYSPSNMDQKGKTYYWRVNATDEENHKTSNLYIFTIESSWWNQNWQYRKCAIIDDAGILEDFQNYPVLIDIFDTDLMKTGAIQPNAEDIVFTTPSGIKLDHEIEAYSSGHLTAWVRIPTIYSTHNNYFYMYYGNPSSSSMENTTAVWDQNYMGVWHLNEGATTVYDSTDNNNDGTKKAIGEPINATGIIYEGQQYDANDDYIGVSDSNSLDVDEEITISAWIYPTGFGGGSTGRIVDKTIGSAYGLFVWSSGGGKLSFYIGDGASHFQVSTADSTISLNSWQYVAATYDKNTANIYINGVNKHSSPHTLDIGTNTDTLYIGNNAAGLRCFDGIIDELRISNKTRSPNWLQTTYNLKNGDYVSFNEESQYEGGIPAVSDPYPANGATNIDINPTLSIYAYDPDGDNMTIIFQTNASTGSWHNIGSPQTDCENGTYVQTTTEMDQTDTTYYWRVCVIDPLGSNTWRNTTYSFSTVPEAPVILEAYPDNEDAIFNPVLKINIYDYQSDSLTIKFKTNATNPLWEELGTYTGGSGNYTQTTTNMDIEDQTYYWSIHVFDGNIWTNNTYSFTAKLFQHKWTYITNADTVIGPLAVDVNGDGIYEVFATGTGKISCINGSTGELIWDHIGSYSSHSPYEIKDLNKDGIPEVVISSGGHTIALHANNGSVYWDVAVASMEKHLVIADIEGDGYPNVFICSSDISQGLDGTGRIRKLNGQTGEVIIEVFAWRPCYGGLSIADVDNDGDFELFMNDRGTNYGDDGYGKGVQCYDADTLELLWYDENVTCSSHCAAIIDVNFDGILDAVIMDQGPEYETQEVNGSGPFCYDGSTGERIPGMFNDTLNMTSHSQFSICDIDNDGNIEVISCAGAPAKVWDLNSWTWDATLGYDGEPPKMADVMGDSNLEIIGTGPTISIYNGSTFVEEETISAASIASTLVQDIDNDGQNELILISGSGVIKVYETTAYAPTPRVRTNSLYYSERNMGAGVYVPPPGAPQPIIKEISPASGSNIEDLNPTLSARIVDFRYDLMNITISTNASGSWIDVATYNEVGNGWYDYTPTNMDEEGKTYYWRVTAVDPYADDLTTNETFIFTTLTPPPFKSGWDYRKKITIDHNEISENLIDFPVLINITDLDVAAHAKTNGDDILFTSIDGATQLDHEIEYYDYTTGELVIWVKTNLSSSQNTIIFMYYGNSLSSNQENVAGVWDDNFVMVHHLEETSGNHYDSTTNSNDGTLINVATQGSADGQIDGADYLDGDNDYVVVPDSDSLDVSGSLTISAWINPDSWGGQNMGRIVDKTLGTSYGLFLRDTGFQRLSFYWYNGTTTDQVDSTTGSISLDEWQHVVVTFDHGTVTFYVDGVQRGMYTGRASSIAANTELLYIGNRESDLARDFDGLMDEIRISNVSRSSSWIEAECNNQKYPYDFMHIGTEENAPVDPGIPNGFTATSVSRTRIDLSWVSDVMADSTYVERNSVSSWIRGAGTEIYNGSGSGYSDIGLTEGTQYFYQAWSWNDSDYVYSSSYASDDATTFDNLAPVFSFEVPVDDSGDIDVDQAGVNVTISDPESDSFDWTIEGVYVNNAFGIGDVDGSKSASLITPLPYESNIIWYVNASDGTDTTEVIYNFTTTTEPVEALNVVLYSPENNSVLDYNDISFACNITDDNRIKNVSLYSNISGTWDLIETKNTTNDEYEYDPSMSLWMHLNKDPLYGETDTLVYDFSGNERNGTVNGATSSTNGKYDGAYSFDGSNDVINLPNDDYDFPGQSGATMAAWVKPTSGQTAASGTIVFIDRGASTSTRMLISVNNDQTVAVKGRSASETFQQCYSTDTIPLDEWSHIVGILNLTSDTAHIYINGEHSITQPMSFTQSTFASTTTQNAGIGAISGQTTYSYKGMIDEAAIYNRVLTADEILDVYKGKMRTSWNVTFNVDDIEDGTYDWNCKAYDEYDHSAWADSNWTFTIASIPDDPTVILTAPANDTEVEEDVIFNCIITDITGIKNASLYTNISGTWELTQIKSPGEYDYEDSMNLWMHLNKDADYGESDTHVYDFSGKGNNGTVNGASYSSDGKIDGAYSFDVSTDYIALQSSKYGLPGQSGASMAAWVKPAIGQTSTSGSVIFIDRAGASATRMLISVNNDGTVSVKGRSADETFQITTTTETIPYDEWSHIVGVINLSSNTGQVYINGDLSISESKSFTQSTFDDTTSTNGGLGAINGFTQFSYKGLIDEAAIFNKSLSSDDIQDLYNNSNPTIWDVSFEINDIPAGTYNWNCLAYDIDDNNAWAENNWIFTVKESFSIQYVHPTPDDGTTIQTQNVTINISSNMNLDSCTLQLLNGTTNNNSFTISIDETMQNKWGFEYPVTYIFDVSGISIDSEVIHRDSLGASWEKLDEKTDIDFFNGIECVRFNSSENKAYVSVGFNSSNTIYIKFLNITTSTYDSVSQFYDNRQSAYTLSNDNWGKTSSANPGASWQGMTNDASDKYQASVHASRLYNIPVSIAINSHMAGGSSMWDRMQDELNFNDYSWEPAIHTRTHPCSSGAYLSNGYSWEILGCRDDILENLTGIPYGQYVFNFILPCGYQDSTVESTSSGEFLFLRDWDGSDHPSNTDFEPWNPTYNYYGIGGLQTKSYDSVLEARSPSGRYYASDVTELNNAFDAVYNSGGIFYAMWHPDRYSNSVIHDTRPGIDGVQGSSFMHHLNHVANRTDVWYAANGWLYSYHYVEENVDVIGGQENLEHIPMTIVNDDENTYAYIKLSDLENGSTYNYRVRANNTIGDTITIPESPDYRSFSISEPAEWWDTNWNYRKKIEINHDLVAGNLVDFPVLINIPSDSEIAFSAQITGDDIVFINQSGVKLNHEIELYNNSNGNLIAWVNVTSLSASEDTILFIYYGNSACSSQENIEGTWGSYYRMVQHLNEKSGLHYDSTSYGNNGTYYGSSQNIAGIIDGADDFVRIDDNNGDYVDCGNDTSLDIANEITVSAWIKPDDQSGWNHLVTKGADNPNRVYQLSITDGEIIDFRLNADETSAAISSTSVPIDSWSYVVGTYDGSNVKVYINGVELGSTSWTNTINTNEVHLRIGSRVRGSGNTGLSAWTFDGTIDEVRVSNPAHSTEWILTEYNNQYVPDSFFDIGIEENAPAGDSILPEITDVIVLMSDPLDTIIGWENFSVIVTDNVEIDMVYLNLTYPDLHTESLPMVKSGDTYYYNTTLSDVGSYSYHIWAEDVNDNSNVSATDSFELPPNWDINIDHDCSIVDLILISNHFDETGDIGWIREDVSNDGDISILDLVLVANHFDETW